MDTEQMAETYSRLETWDETFDRLFDTKELADVEIIVRPGPKEVLIKAHKFVLSLASPEFYRIINELNTTGSNSIIIEDAEPEDVETMLRYVYKRKYIFTSEEQSLNIISLAVRYHLSRLEESCFRHVEHRIQANNACEIYQRAYSLGQLELVYKSFECIKKETSKALKETELRDLESSTLEKILKEERLNIPSELELLETLIKWGKVQRKVRCEGEESVSLRQIINHLLKHIRFLCITKEDFAEVQHKTEIFSNEEVGQIMMRYLYPGSSDLPEWFNSHARPRAYDDDVKIRIPVQHSWSNVSHKPYCCSHLEKKITSTFITKEKFFIRGFQITMCKFCSFRNKIAGKHVIEMKIAIAKEGTDVRKGCCQLNVLSGQFKFEYDIGKEIYRYEPLVLKEKFATRWPLNFYHSFGMDAPPTLSGFMDGDISILTGVAETPCLLPSIKVEVMPPITVEIGEAFSLTMESEQPFYSCKSVPLFDNSPFSAFHESTRDPARLFIWCFFDSIQYSLAACEEPVIEK